MKAKEKNLAIDPDFYKRIGSAGGKKTVPKGFAINKALASSAGRTGGRISKRKKKVLTTE